MSPGEEQNNQELKMLSARKSQTASRLSSLSAVLLAFSIIVVTVCLNFQPVECNENGVGSTPSTQRSPDTLVIRDPVNDLSRLTNTSRKQPAVEFAKQNVQKQQQQQDQVAAANRRSSVELILPEIKLANYINQQHQKQQLAQIYRQLAPDQTGADSQLTESPPILQGKRRLDVSNSLAYVNQPLPIISLGDDFNAAPMSQLEGMALAASLNNNRKVGRRLAGAALNENMHNKIVDYGSNTLNGLGGNRRRSSSERSNQPRDDADGYQPRANKPKRQRTNISSQESRRRPGKSYPIKGRQTRIETTDDDPDSSASGGASGEADEDDAERASDRRSDAFDRNGGDDDGSKSSRLSGGRRQRDDEVSSSLDSAEDASGVNDDDEQSNSNNDDDDEDGGPVGGRPDGRQSGGGQRYRKLKQAASTGRQSTRSHGRGDAKMTEQKGRQSGRLADDSDADDDDESTDSTNTHQREMVAGDDVTSRRASGYGQLGETDNNTKMIRRQAEAALAATAAYDEQSGGQRELSPGGSDLQTAAGQNHGHKHGHYYQFVEVPKKKAWKFGFKRGNHKHEIERKEKGYKHKFHSEFHWHAKEKCKKKKKCKSVGKMTWDYKHHKKP